MDAMSLSHFALRADRLFPGLQSRRFGGSAGVTEERLEVLQNPAHVDEERPGASSRGWPWLADNAPPLSRDLPGPGRRRRGRPACRPPSGAPRPTPFLRWEGPAGISIPLRHIGHGLRRYYPGRSDSWPRRDGRAPAPSGGSPGPADRSARRGHIRDEGSAGRPGP